MHICIIFCITFNVCTYIISITGYCIKYQNNLMLESNYLRMLMYKESFMNTAFEQFPIVMFNNRCSILVYTMYSIQTSYKILYNMVYNVFFTLDKLIVMHFPVKGLIELQLLTIMS